MLRIVLLLLGAILAVPVQAAGPEDTVKAFHDSLLSLMRQGENLGCAGRIKQLETTVEDTFDLPFVARQVLRKRWDQLSPPQREQFTAAMKELTVVSYASNFRRYNGETFSNEAAQDSGGGRRQVRTHLKPANAASVTLDYFLHEAGGRWRVINVVADGVSDLALRSAQYDRSFQQDGYEGFMKRLREQLAKNRAACS